MWMIKRITALSTFFYFIGESMGLLQTYLQKDFHGYIASKKRYFFGVKVHMIVNAEGIPMQYLLSLDDLDRDY